MRSAENIILILLASVACATWDREYRILNLTVGSNFEAVKSAYRREALKWHPDRNSAPEAQARFIEATEAYEVLKAGLLEEKQVGPVRDAFQVFQDFMNGGTVSFSIGRGTGWMAGSSQSSSTVTRNGRRVTKTVVTDLATGRSETTTVEEDLNTGVKSVTVNNSLELYLTQSLRYCPQPVEPTGASKAGRGTVCMWYRKFYGTLSRAVRILIAFADVMNTTAFPRLLNSCLF